MKKRIIWIIAAVLVIAAVSWGPLMSNVEQAKYDVVENHGKIEIRDYAPMIVAEVSVSGNREDAVSNGFRLIADYIFGNNKTSQEVAMTAPVIQQPGEKIAMTAPVTQQGGDDSWTVRFVMPASYSMQTLPRPNNPDVTLKEIAQKRFAAIRFSGIAKDKALETQAMKLQDFINDRNLVPLSEPTYAFFNPPWTLPFLRRNEVMVEVGR